MEAIEIYKDSVEKILHFPESESLQNVWDNVANDVLDFFEQNRLERMIIVLSEAVDLKILDTTTAINQLDKPLLAELLGSISDLRSLITLMAKLSNHYKDFIYWQTEDNLKGSNG